jgi:hypothetical protein
MRSIRDEDEQVFAGINHPKGEPKPEGRTTGDQCDQCNTFGFQETNQGEPPMGVQ